MSQGALALAVVAALSGCRTASEPRTAPVDPMASFARLLPGEWQATFPTGESLFDTWHWGPGRHSVRAMTDGAEANGDPWRGIKVAYWHPGRKQVRLFSVEPHGGVMDGSIAFDGDHAAAVFDLHQPGGRRDMGMRWTFDGADRYDLALLEGPGLPQVNGWTYLRHHTPVAPHRRGRALTATSTERLQAFAPLLDRTWEVAGRWRTTVQWVPVADAIYARTVALTDDGAHVLDAYVYHQPGPAALRCLALSSTGAVYEGDVTVLAGGALGFDLTRTEGDRTVGYAMRFDLEPDGALHQQVWSVDGATRTPVLDLRHTRR